MQPTSVPLSAQRRSLLVDFSSYFLIPTPHGFACCFRYIPIEGDLVVGTILDRQYEVRECVI